MFNQILEQLNKLTEEEFDFEDIEIEQKLDFSSSIKISELNVNEKEKYPIFQALLDKANDLTFFSTNEKQVVELLREGPKELLSAYVLAAFNYQVTNGGFEQWVDNDYVFTIDDIMLALLDINSSVSKGVRRMLFKMVDFLDIDTNDWNINNKEYGEYEAETFDEEYYGIADQLCKDIENYFRSILEQRDVTESVVDFPRPELENSIWNKQDSIYIIKEEVKNKIFDILSKYKEFDLRENAEAIHITGSIGTNLYKNETDVDVHIILNKDIEFSEDQQKAVFSWFKKNRDEIDGYIEEHPIEVYVQLNPDQELISDAVYDILSNNWIIGPTIFPPDYDPYEKYEHILSDVAAEALHADELIGELKRDTIDYAIIRDAIANMSIDERSNLLLRLQGKLEEIEDGIKKLKSTKQSWIDARKSSSQPKSGEQALSDIELARKWKDKNAEFKFLDRYNYMRLIKDLEIMIEDDKISDTEVDIIKGLL